MRASPAGSGRAQRSAPAGRGTTSGTGTEPSRERMWRCAAQSMSTKDPRKWPRELADAAVGHFERAFTHVARTADRALECTALTGLARSLSLQGRHDDALSMLQHARALAQRTGNTSDMAQVQLALAVVEQGRGRHAAAEPHLHTALSVLRRSPDQTLEAQVQLHLAISLWSTGGSQAALARLDRVGAAAQLIGSPALLMRSSASVTMNDLVEIQVLGPFATHRCEETELWCSIQIGSKRF